MPNIVVMKYHKKYSLSFASTVYWIQLYVELHKNAALQLFLSPLELY